MNHVGLTECCNSAASSLSSKSRTYIDTQQYPAIATTAAAAAATPQPPPPQFHYTANDNNNSQISISNNYNDNNFTNNDSINNYNDVERREEKFCKICHESSSSSQTLSPTQPSIDSTNSSFWSNLFTKKHKEKNKLISPCRCKGSLQYVHLECLNKWRKSNTRSDSAYQCEVCKYRYKMYRPFIIHIIDSEIFLHLMTIIVFLLLVYLVSCLMQVIDFKWITPGGPAGEEKDDWKYTTVLNLYLVHIIINTSMGGPLGCSGCVGSRGFGSGSTFLDFSIRNIWNFIDKLLDNQKHK
nr:12963_t:CDS:2 [Entrophospora candida]